MIGLKILLSLKVLGDGGLFWPASSGVVWVRGGVESEGLNTKWEQVKIWKEAVPYDFGNDAGIQEEAEYNAFIRIKDTKNRRLREADYPVGREILFLRNQYQKW